jgi:hypothetical protein
MWLLRLQICMNDTWTLPTFFLQCRRDVSPWTSLNLWSNLSSLYDNDSECHTAWFEAAEPNMIDFCFSLDVICGSWKTRKRSITLEVGIQFHETNVRHGKWWQMVTNEMSKHGKDTHKLLLFLTSKSINRIHTVVNIGTRLHKYM